MRRLSFLRVLTLEDSRFVSGVSTISTLLLRRHDVSCHSYEAWSAWHTPVCPCFSHTEDFEFTSGRRRRVTAVEEAGLQSLRLFGMSQRHRDEGTRVLGYLEVMRNVCIFRSFSKEKPCSRPRAEAVLPSQSCVELARARRVSCHWTGTSRAPLPPEATPAPILYTASSFAHGAHSPHGLRTGAPRWENRLASRLFPREADSGVQVLGKAKEASQRLAWMGGVPTLAGLSGVSV